MTLICQNRSPHKLGGSRFRSTDYSPMLNFFVFIFIVVPKFTFSQANCSLSWCLNFCNFVSQREVAPLVEPASACSSTKMARTAVLVMLVVVFGVIALVDGHGTPFVEKYFDQVVDHFNFYTKPLGKDTYKQRYLVQGECDVPHSGLP